MNKICFVKNKGTGYTLSYRFLVSTFYLAPFLAISQEAYSASYFVSSEMEFVSAIEAINSSGDSEGRITLLNDMKLSESTILPDINKHVVIDTVGGHSLIVHSGISFDRNASVVGDGGLVITSQVGQEGDLSQSGGTMTFRDGANYTAGSRSRWLIGYQDNSTTNLIASGEGTVVNAGRMGSYGVGDNSKTLVRVVDGAQIKGSSRTSVLTDTTHSNDGIATIEVVGQGSLFSMGSLESGLRGSATYYVSDRGRIETGKVNLGGNLVNRGAGDKVYLSGDGSSWDASGHVQYHEGKMFVLDGATFTAEELSVAHSSRNVSVVASGASTIQTTLGNINVGGTGTGILTVSGGATVKAASGTGDIVLADRAGGAGIINIGAEPGSSAKVAGSIEAARVVFGDGDAQLNFNHSDSVYVFAPELSGSGVITHKGAGLTRLERDNPDFLGVTNIDGGTLSVNGVLGGTMNVTGGRLQGVGRVGSTHHGANGTIAPGNSFGTLTIDGDYVGSGGLFELETQLGEDDSPTDRVIINGDSSGTANIRVINTGGKGALTAEGIKLIEVSGASDTKFSLLGDYSHEGRQAVVGGAYAYTLHQDGVADPDDGSWYLRSTRMPATSPDTPPSPDAPAEPLYQAGVPLYDAYSRVLLGMTRMSTLQQRVGNRSWQNGEDSASSPSNFEGKGAWFRIEGAHERIKPDASTSEMSYELDRSLLQMGVDGQLSNDERGTLVAGMSAQYVSGSADVASVFGVGEIDTAGWGVAGSLTWYAANGLYVDGQTQVVWFESDLVSSTAGRSMANGIDATGYAASLEIGRNIGVGSNWSLVPQAQVIYTALRSHDFTDQFEANVAFDTNDSLRTRIGVSPSYENRWVDDSGQSSRVHAYGIANLYYNSMIDAEVDIEGVEITHSIDRWEGGIGFGGSYNWLDDKYSVYGELALETGLDDIGESLSSRGAVGFRVAL